jgi:hypothetical protein
MVSRNIAIMSSVTAAVGVVATAALARLSGVPDCNGSVRRVPDPIWVSGLRGGGGAFIRRMVLPIKVAGIVPAVIYFSRLSGGRGLVGASHAAPDRAIALIQERCAGGATGSQSGPERRRHRRGRARSTFAVARLFGAAMRAAGRWRGADRPSPAPPGPSGRRAQSLQIIIRRGSLSSLARWAANRAASAPLMTR